MVKKLVFFIYIGDYMPIDEYKVKYPTMALHLHLLQMYADVFDEAVFILSLKKELIGDKDLIAHYIRAIVDLGFYRNVKFKIEENTNFRECKAFKEEVVDNRENDGKLVFFGHNKGTTNEYNESLIRLICSMYYFNLNFMDSVEWNLIADEATFYGFPLLNAEWSEPDATCVMPLYKYFFYGTFFWTNWTVMNEIVTHKGREYPKLASRFYAENFPANVAELKTVGTYKNIYGLSGRNLHYDFDGFLDEYCGFMGESGKEVRKQFNEFVDRVKSLIS